MFGQNQLHRRSALSTASSALLVVTLMVAHGCTEPVRVNVKSEQGITLAGPKRLVAGWKASWSPDATRLVYGNVRGPGLQILNLEDGRVTDLIDFGKDPAWSPDGRFIAFVKEPRPFAYLAEEVWLVQPTGQSPRKLADGGFPIWSRDGKRLFIHSRTENNICSIDVDDPSAEPEVYFDRPQSWYPAISPDGKRLAFGRPGALVVVERETGQTVLTWPTPGTRGLLPAWSPDGKRIAFGSFTSNSSNLGLWVLDLDTQQAVEVAKGRYTMPAWSNDGSKIAFDLRSPSGREVWMVETRALAALTPSRPAPVAMPSWVSPPPFDEEIGSVAPDIEGVDTDGVRFKLSDYRGKVVVLDFWGDW